jgi:hypothetical protein
MGIENSDPELVLEALKEKEYFSPLFKVLTEERSPLESHIGMSYIISSFSPSLRLTFRSPFTFIHSGPLHFFSELFRCDSRLVEFFGQ